MTRGLLAAAVALVLLPGAAAAQTGNSFYYGELRGGAAFLSDADIDDRDGVLALTGIEVEIDSKVGWLAEGAIGYADASGGRVEIAVGYRKNQFDEITIDPGGVSTTSDFDGDITALTTMFNAYYDFNAVAMGAGGPIGERLTPFVGVGVGAAFMSADLDEIDESDDDTVFAWQLMAGLAYNFTPNMAATFSYAYFATSDPEFEGIEFDYASHNVIVGLRFGF